MKVIYKVEINFDPNNLSPDELDGICEQTDQIFEEEDLDCAVREPGMSRHLQECFWYNESTEQKFDLFCTFLVVCDIIHRVTGKYYPYHHPCGVKKQSCIVLFGVDLSRGCGQKVLV